MNDVLRELKNKENYEKYKFDFDIGTSDESKSK